MQPFENQRFYAGNREVILEQRKRRRKTLCECDEKKHPRAIHCKRCATLPKPSVFLGDPQLEDITDA